MMLKNFLFIIPLQLQSFIWYLSSNVIALVNTLMLLPQQSQWSGWILNAGLIKYLWNHWNSLVFPALCPLNIFKFWICTRVDNDVQNTKEKIKQLSTLTFYLFPINGYQVWSYYVFFWNLVRSNLPKESKITED